MAAAALVVVPGLGFEPFWRDETWSVTIAHRSLAGTLDVLRNREANMYVQRAHTAPATYRPCRRCLGSR